MLDSKKVDTTVITELKALTPNELLQLKGGNGTTSDGIIIEDIIDE